MDILWVVNTNTFLLVILIIMVSYLRSIILADQMNKREWLAQRRIVKKNIKK
jgi:hypothetical protein